MICEDEALTFVDRAQAVFGDACAAGMVQRRFQVANSTVVVRAPSAALVDRVTRAWAHLRLHDDGASIDDVALTIDVWDDESTNTRIPAAPWPREVFDGRTSIQIGDGERLSASYQMGAHTFSMFDHRTRRALYWTRDVSAIPNWELSFPFRPILHWWCRTTSFQPVHAGAVGIDGNGVLIAGRSGIGKTTTTLSAVVGGMQYCGDDYVLVDSAACRVFSLYGTAKLTADSLARFPSLDASLAYPLAGEEKTVVDIDAAFPKCLTRELAISAIAVPRVTGLETTTISPIATGDAVRALAPTTLAHLPGQGESTLAKLTRLCAQVPCIEIATGTDLAEIPHELIRWLRAC